MSKPFIDGLPTGCASCGYWMRPDEDFCANCGATSRDHRAPWRRQLKARTRAATAAVAAVWTGLAEMTFGLPLAYMLVMMLVIAGISVHITGAVSDVIVQKRLAVIHPASLMSADGEITRQLESNDMHVARLLSARATVEDVVPAGAAGSALALIDMRHSVREREQMLLRTRRWAIRLARWVNALTPALEDFHLVGYDDVDRRLELTGRIREGGRALHRVWSSDPAAQTPEGAELLTRLDDAIAGVDTLRSELALRKALLADPAASPLALAQPVSPVVERELTRFAQLAVELGSGCYATAVDVDDAQRVLDAETDLRDAA